MHMIPTKTPAQLRIMQEGGQINAFVRQKLVQAAQVGVSTKNLDDLAETLIRSRGAKASFKGYQGFPAHIVTCINEEVVHGIPSSRQLQKGDLLTIDLGILYRGFHTDSATTILIGPVDRKQPIGPTHLSLFLKAGQLALQRAINQCSVGNSLGDISATIQRTIEQAGYNVIRAFVGHGIGQALHEPPQIPCFGQENTGGKLMRGMTLAVEVMYTLGQSELKILKDNWTAVTLDGKIAAMFEHTIAVTQKGPLILTK